MGFFGIGSSGKQVIDDVEISPSGRYTGNTRTFQTVVQKFPTNKRLRDVVILKLQEQAGLRCGGSGEGFSRC